MISGTLDTTSGSGKQCRSDGVDQRGVSDRGVVNLHTYALRIEECLLDITWSILHFNCYSD